MCIFFNFRDVKPNIKTEPLSQQEQNNGAEQNDVSERVKTEQIKSEHSDPLACSAPRKKKKSLLSLWEIKDIKRNMDIFERFCTKSFVYLFFLFSRQISYGNGTGTGTEKNFSTFITFVLNPVASQKNKPDEYFYLRISGKKISLMDCMT